MTKNYLFMAVVVIIVLIGGAIILNNRSTTDMMVNTTANTSGEAMMANETTNTSSDAMMPANETANATGGAMEKESKEGTMVEIKDFAFAPKTVTVKVGDTVTWENKDSVAHTATADDKSFDTGMLAQGKKGSVTFDKAGTYTYHCTPHPNMKGTIIVE